MRLLLILISIIFISIPSYAVNFPATKVYEVVSPSVVVVRASNAAGGGMIGAGSIISKDGLIITNAHVVIDRENDSPHPNVGIYLKPDKLTGVTGNDLSRYFKAQVLYYSKDLDLALLKVPDLPSEIPVIELADVSGIKIGEEVVAIGHPEQGGFWSLTYGRISGEMQDYKGISGKDMYQTDTSVNRGNSGGPLLDERGYMVAVNSNIARIGKGGLPITGVNFAIKSSVVKRWLSEKDYSIAYGKAPIMEDKKEVAAGLPDLLEGKLQEDTSKVEQEIPEIHIPDDRILTPKIPYNYDNLLKAVEEDMEEIMDEMKEKIKGLAGDETSFIDKDVEELSARPCSTSEEGLKVCIAEAIARLGDDTTPAVARTRALNNAERNALEKAVGVDLRSSSFLYNSELVSELVVTRTKGLIVKKEILEEEFKGPIYRILLRAYIDPIKLEKRGIFKIIKADLFETDKALVPRHDFHDNDKIQIKIKVNSEAYLNIFSVDQDEKIIKLFPNPYVKSEIVPARTEFIYPDKSQELLGIKLKVKTPKNLSRAIESVLIIATKEKVDFLSDKNREEVTITDLMGELSELDPSLWTDKVVGYEVRK